MVRIVVPFSAGSITDGLARILADKLATMWKQQVIVENRAGLPGTTGVAKAPPDGYTLMLTSNGHTIAGVINKNLQFDPVKDFAGVSQVAAVPMVMIVPPDFPAKSLKEFLQMAKDKPGQLNFSSAGVASTSFLSAEIMRQNAERQHGARALQGRARGRDRGGARRRADVFRPDPLRAGARRGRQGEGDGDQFGQARAATARHADRRRVGAARLQIRLLVRRHGAGRHAEADPRQGQPRTSRWCWRCPT